MKKTIMFMALTTLSACTLFAQDTIHNGTVKKSTSLTRKKSMHQRSNDAVPIDSVSEGKITTNPHGKTGSKSPASRKKSVKDMTPSTSNKSKNSTR